MENMFFNLDDRWRFGECRLAKDENEQRRERSRLQNKTQFPGKKSKFRGSGCGTVGRAVASDTRGPLFEYSHRQFYLLTNVLKLFWKDENKEVKRSGMAQFKKVKILIFKIVRHAVERLLTIQCLVSLKWFNKQKVIPVFINASNTWPSFNCSWNLPSWNKVNWNWIC